MIRKTSKQRDMILSYMRKMSGHISAEQLYEQMNEEGLKISLATVYRNLAILEEMNEIKKIAHPIGGYLYDKTCKPHYHMHCLKCNELLDLNIPYLEEINHMLQKQTDADILAHSLIVEGICPDCKK